MVGRQAREQLRIANGEASSVQDQNLLAQNEPRGKVNPYQDLICQLLELRSELEETRRENMSF